MINLKNKIKNINFIDFFKNKYLLIALIIVLIFLGNLVRVEYSRCTYRMYANPYLLEYEHYIVIGRYMAAIFWKIVNIIGLTLNQTYFVSYIIGIIAITLSIYICFKILKKFIDNNILNILISTAVTLNCFFIDYFIYIEKGIFTLSILFTIISINFLLNYFDTNEKRNIIFSFLVLCLASFSYQGTVALFVSIATIFIIKYSSTIKKFILNNILTAFIYGTTMGVSYILVRLVGSQSTSRTTGEFSILENLKEVIKAMKYVLIDTSGVLPRYFFLITFMIVFAMVVFCILFNKKAIKEKVIQALGYVYILAACLITSILPQLVIDTAAINLSARAIYPFASIIALSLIYLFVVVIPKKEVFKTLSIFILSIYMLVQYFGFNSIITDHYTLNYVEKELALNIGSIIEKYEKENNIEIKTIIFYNDKNSKYTYEDLKSYASINERVFRTTWCRIEILNYYLNRDFVQSFETKDEYVEKFSKVDYIHFSEEELIFENETLHLCIY